MHRPIFYNHKLQNPCFIIWFTIIDIFLFNHYSTFSYSEDSAYRSLRNTNNLSHSVVFFAVCSFLCFSLFDLQFCFNVPNNILIDHKNPCPRRDSKRNSLTQHWRQINFSTTCADIIRMLKSRRLR
mgnify:CR=1 FL=1